MVATYFHQRKAGADCSDLKRIHQQQFPRNELAILKTVDGSWLVKVAYPRGTPQPAGTLTREQAIVASTPVSPMKITGNVAV